MPPMCHRRPPGFVRRFVVLLVSSASMFVVAPSVSADIGDTVDGRYSGQGLRPAGSTLRLDVAGRSGVPADAVAVALNVTITGAVGPGYATAFPCGSSRPDASTVNFDVGVTIANGIVAPVGRAGQVCIFTSERVHLIADVSGSIAPGSGYRSQNSQRVLETRPRGVTFDGRYNGVGRIGEGEVMPLEVAGRGAVPSSADAVVLNLTVTEPDGPGFATVFPCGSTRPDASTINFTAGTTIANSVIAPVGREGQVCIYSSERAHVVADVAGSFTSGFRALNPARLLDSRSRSTTIDGRFVGLGVRGAGQVLELDVAGRGGVPDGADAVALNLTVTETAGPGFATVFPCGSSRPDASTINFTAGTTIANSVVAPVGRRGQVCIFTSERTHLVVDVSGSFTSGYRTMNPARIVDTRSPEQPAPDPAAEAAQHSLALLNHLRARHGAGPVALDTGMSSQALAWSAEMSRSGFRHSSLGYAENIAWHSLASMSPVEAAERLHEMWVDSPGHFRNMIDPRWTRVGIGLHRDASGWHGTHVFDD